MRRWVKRGLLAVAAGAAAIWVNNTSLLATDRTGPPSLLAHRGVHQLFERDGLTAETCTAERMLPPTHDYLENTIRSMAAAFEAGADVVEFDIHPTRDGHFAVFHDWTVDCRTDGSGVTRDHTMDELRVLDIGYGYTADGGASHPFRGLGIDRMPTLDEVLEAFPARRFLIHIKSNDPAEGARLAERLAMLASADRARLMVYGGASPVAVVAGAFPDMPTLWAARMRECLLRYGMLGWSGYVPEACRTAVLLVPVNVAPWLWGWPDRFLDRMEAVGAVVYVLGPWDGGEFSSGVDEPEEVARLPEGFTGGVWTNRIETIGPLLLDPDRTR